MAVQIRNTSAEPVTLPFPLTGVLRGGQGIVLSALSVSGARFLAGPGLEVTEVADLASNDDARYFPWADGLPGGSLVDGSVDTRQLANASVTPEKMGSALGDEAQVGGLLGNMLVVRRNFAAGAGGAAGDVTIASAGLGFGALLVDVILHVTTGVEAATVTLRDHSGGTGNALSSDIAAATEGIARTTHEGEIALLATTPLYLRRSDTGVAGFVDLVLLRA